MHTESEVRIVDLSHPVTDDTPFFAGEEGIRIIVLEKAGGVHASGRRSLNCSRLDTNVHCGTHMDAPFHFYNEGTTIDQIPLERCVGPTLLIDVSFLKPRETLPAQALRGQSVLLNGTKRVVLRTGWAREWGRPHYFSDHPVLAKNSAEFLVAAGIKLIGVDIPSVDYPPFPAHLALLGADAAIVENLTNLEQIPPGMFHLTVVPLKILGRDASPVRAFAQIT